MKRLLLALGLSFLLTGCFSTNYWSSPTDSRQGYGVWTHDDTDNGCNEWDTEPLREVDNNGDLCRSFVP